MLISKRDSDRLQGILDIPVILNPAELNKWELAFYIEKHANQIDTLKAGELRDPALTWPEYVLLPEAMAIVDQAKHVYLWPLTRYVAEHLIERCTSCGNCAEVCLTKRNGSGG